MNLVCFPTRVFNRFLDSRCDFPRLCGKTSEGTLIKDAGKHCTDLAEKLGGTISFSAIALVGEE